MMGQKVLIVEDECLIAEMVAYALSDAGYDVCGIAASESEALRMANNIHPALAVVDVRLAPGNGKNVARQLADRFGTTVLMATSEPVECLHDIGARGVIPKPYREEEIGPALRAAQKIAEGGDPGALPDHMKVLRP